MVRTRRQTKHEEKNGAAESKQTVSNDDFRRHGTTPRKRKAHDNVENHPKEQKQRHDRTPKRHSTDEKVSSTSDVEAPRSEEEKGHETSSGKTDPGVQKIEDLIAKYGNFPLSDVGLNSPDEAAPETILAHVLNVLLLSVRISHRLARRALLGLVSHGYHDLKKLRASTCDERVAVLDESGYARYDHRAATELGQLADLIESRYGAFFPTHQFLDFVVDTLTL